MSKMKIARICLSAMVVFVVSWLTSPLGVSILDCFKSGSPDGLLALGKLLQSGPRSWLDYAMSALLVPEKQRLFVAWMGVVVSFSALAFLKDRLETPSRDAGDVSPLGNARIADGVFELRRKLSHWNGKGEPKGVSLVLSGGKNGYLFHPAVPHWLVVAKTGAGKSQLMVLETLHLLMASGANFICTGKPELVELTGQKAAEEGYRRVIFSLDGYPGASSYNLLDLVAEYAESGNLDAAQKTARQTAADLIPVDSAKDGFFPKAARSALTAVILAVAYADIPREQKNMASVYEIVSRGTAGQGEDPSLPLKNYLRELGPGHPAFGPASEFLSDGGVTTAGKNVLSSLKEPLSIFGDEGIRRITSKSEISMRELFREKTAVYIQLMEEGDPYQVIFACFFNQYWRIAQEEAKANGGRLPRETLILADEFGNMGRVDCVPQIATLGRSMKLKLALFVQDLKQLNVYSRSGDNGAGRDKILGSIGGKVALSLANPEDFAYFTKLVGKRTVRTHASSQQTRGSQGSGRGQSYSEQADDLIHEWEWQNRVATRDGAIAIIGGENGAPGSEGVYRLPLAYANRTPAGDYFGLGSEDFERAKRLGFYYTMLEECGAERPAPVAWCPDFDQYGPVLADSEAVAEDEFAAWD